MYLMFSWKPYIYIQIVSLGTVGMKCEIQFLLNEQKIFYEVSMIDFATTVRQETNSLFAFLYTQPIWK